MHAFEVTLIAVWIIVLLATLLNVILTPRVKAGRRAGGPLVSVIIPARDEERAIGQTVRGMLDQAYRDLEVIVIDDRSTDGTAGILAAFDDRRLTVIHGADTPEGWLGKPWALHQGSQSARGEILLFVDADIIYAPYAVGGMVDMIESAGVDMLSVLPHFEMHGVGEHVGMMGLITSLMGVISPWIINRTRAVWMGIGAGVGNMVRRDAYAAIGGHTCLRDAVIDDVGLGQQLRRGGRTTYVAFATDLVSVRMYHGLAEVVNGFTKNAFTALDSYVAVILVVAMVIAVDLMPFVLAILGHPLALIAVGLLIAARLALFVPLGYPVPAALFLHPVTAAVWIYIILRSAWLVGVRGEVSWRGRRNVQWSRFGR